MDRKKRPVLLIVVCFAVSLLLLLAVAKGMKPQVLTWSLLAAFNHAPSEFMLANHLMGTRYHTDTGIALMREAGEHGFGPAQNFLGWWYDEHPMNEGNYDYQQAEYWYNKAAAQGIMSSVHNLGRVYEKTGRFDLVEAQFLKAAEKDWPSAQNSLGHWYYTSKNNKGGHDLEKAEYWFTRAAEKDHDLALHSLGSLHRDRGEYDKAIGFFEKSYEKGKNRPVNQSAKALAYFYHKGPAPEYHSREKAMYWYSELAKRGGADDLYQAAFYYLDSAGEDEENWNSPQVAQGMKWMMESRSKGDKDAIMDVYRKFRSCFGIVSEQRRYGCAMLAAAENEYARLFLAVDGKESSGKEYDHLRRDAVAGEAEAQLVLINLLMRAFDDSGPGREPYAAQVEDFRRLYILHNVFLNGSSQSRQYIPDIFINDYKKVMDDVIPRLVEHMSDDRAAEASACARLYNSDKGAFGECLYPGYDRSEFDVIPPGPAQ